MNQISRAHFPARQLRESSQDGWIHATGVCGMSVDKAGLYAPNDYAKDEVRERVPLGNLFGT